MEAKLLRVDLTTGKIWTEILPHALFERWVGGSGINDWILWEHFQRHDVMCDPRGPDNIFIFGIGPLAGTGSGIGVKGRITFKSPEYGTFADSAGGGKFPYMVRFTGYDHIVTPALYGEKTPRRPIRCSSRSSAIIRRRCTR
jgi:aldehyde:ferredoxin oxidoreductase